VSINYRLIEAANLIRLTLQSLTNLLLFFYVMYTDTAQSDIGSSCFFTLPGSTSDRPVDFFRILRIAFLSTSPKRSSLTATADCGRRRRGSVASATGLAGSLPFAAFTYETFTPELVARCTASTDVVERLDVVDRIETMNETFAKVMAFLQNSGTGVGLMNIHLFIIIKSFNTMKPISSRKQTVFGGLTIIHLLIL